jgi:uncharacterized protein YkwD
MRRAVKVENFVLVFLFITAGAAQAQHSETRRTGQGHPLGCRPSSAEASEISQVFQQLNQYRQAQGRPALAYDLALEECIEGHCHHMQAHGFFAHNGPAGEPETSTPWERARRCGTTASAENIARGQRNATDVMNAWRSSRGHNANMLSGATRVGIGYYENGRYWGQLFGTGNATSPGSPGGGIYIPPPQPAPSPGGNTPPGGNPPAAGNNPPPIGNPAPPQAPGSQASSTSQQAPRPPKIVPPGLLKR